jgi:predicted acylesterase/phospholipase RssA
MRNVSALLVVFLIGAVALQGCASLESHPSANGPLVTETPFDEPMRIRTLGADLQYAQLDAGLLAQRLENSSEEPVNILALSGGGAGGAFGAGALVGLTQSGRRPQFAVVTGVSAGALIAPYAFLGPAWDQELMDIYTTGAGDHMLQSRGLGALFGSSLYRGRPLRELVDRYTTDALIQAIAREAAKGRLLLVATTDMNTGAPVVWDLGAIAMHGGRDARTLFRDILVASASVPGLFPPVVIRNETHIDGGVTIPFFIAPSPAEIAGVWDERARRPKLYVLIDGQMSEQPRTTQLRATAIMSRSVNAGLNQMLRTTLQLTATTAEQRGLALDYAAIPVTYPYRGALNFSAATVRPLFEYAYECARAARLWTAFRPSAASIPDDVQDPVLNRELPCPADDAFIERFAARAR